MPDTHSEVSQIEYDPALASAGTNTHTIPSLNLAGAEPVAIETDATLFTNWCWTLKRAEDLIIAPVLLLVAGPVMLLVAVLVALDSPGPVMIRQRRYGYGNVPFLIYKFRTMYFDPADLSGVRPTVRGDKRVTRVGRMLRATSLDELPQLLNVLRGEMSLVGPRPHPVDMQVEGHHYHHIAPLYLTRHRVRPGITGLAQINGCRGLVDSRAKAERRLEYDLSYIESWSLRLDLVILMRTLVKGFTSSGAF